MKRTEKWYQRRLAKYVTDNYGEYEDEIEYYVEPAPHGWLLYIPSLDVDLFIWCDDNGVVGEQKVNIRGTN